MLMSWQQYGETTITFNKDVKSLKEKTGQTQDDIEDLERKLTEKIDKLQQEVKTLKVSLSYAQEESASLKEGKHIFILFIDPFVPENIQYSV